ncbi:hypothetical protein OPV22_031518 [Ensete ventricosum]|uniref:Protein kinase domain-containing protein n=1 Tax=Ensete ventricosum TaxID=4639 RepID=A0AAV8PTT7_ENSVE|nr:hypothetical protein OPV22_031518 [Ensete ventricosum]
MPRDNGVAMKVKENHDGSLQLESCQFTYIELKNVTNNFGKVLAKGGNGTVYHGYMKDGTQVAVNMWSQSSSQGTKDFLLRLST